MWTYLNGEFIPKKDVRISPFDRGFLFGDSVYEVIPSYDNQPFLFNEHLERLKRSLSVTKIPIPDYLNHFNLLIMDLIQRNKYPNQAIYIQITRGEDPERAHVSSSTTTPTLFMSSTELEINPYRLDPNKNYIIRI